MLLSVSLLLSTVSFFLSWPLLLSHDLSCFFQFLCCSLMTSYASFSVSLLLCTVSWVSFHGLCCCFTDFAALLLPLMASVAPLPTQLISPGLLCYVHYLCYSINRVCCCFTALFCSFTDFSAPFFKESRCIICIGGQKFMKHFPLCFRYFSDIKLERKHEHSYFKSRI
jgi:hypothetical protein